MVDWTLRSRATQYRGGAATVSRGKTALILPQVRNTAMAAWHLGWRLWKERSGYHWRSLVETTMGRFKLPGERLAVRQPERQVAEIHVRGAILNTFNRLGMPATVSLA